MTDTDELAGEWHRVGTILVLVADDTPDPQIPSGQVALTVEAKDEARRVSLDVDPDKPPAIIARWRDGVPESVNVFAGDYFPGPVCEAIRDQLKAFVAGGPDLSVSEVIVHGNGCSCHASERVLDRVRRLRRLYYAGELASRGAPAELGSFVADIQHEAGELYEDMVTALFALGSVAQRGAGALTKLRTAALTRARLDLALTALAAVPTDPDLTPSAINRREEIMHDLAEAEADEHDAIIALTVALMGKQ